MVKKFIWAIAAACLVACPGLARAGEVDVLVQKLVDKGILSPYEAQIVLDDTKQEVAKQNAKGTNEAIPSWVQTTKLKGDFRLRHEVANDKGSVNDNRTRVRMRLGVEAKPNDKTMVGVGFATGKLSDPRSTNVTLGSDSSSAKDPNSFKDITLDYAYALYAPFNGVSLMGGKIKNPLWQPNDMIWDTDINPDAIGMQLSRQLFTGVDVFMNNMLGIMYDTRTAKNSEPYMLALQPGFSVDLAENINLKAATTYYQFTSVKNSATFTKRSTNSVNGAGLYAYNYNSIQPSVELAFSNLFGDTFLPYVAVSGDYINNLSMPKVASGSDGFDVGLKFGDKKVGDKGQWQSKLIYARLGRDAFLDIYPDSDRYSGKTNMRSYEGILEYGLGKNTSIGLDYYYAESLTKTGATHVPQQIVQVDWNLKF